MISRGCFLITSMIGARSIQRDVEPPVEHPHLDAVEHEGKRVLGGHDDPGADARQRCAEIVRNGIEQRGFQGVALTSDLGGGRLRRQAVTSKPEGELVGRERQQPRLFSGRRTGCLAPARPHRPEHLAVDLDLHAEHAHAIRTPSGSRADRALGLRALGSDVRPQPAGRLIAGCPNEHVVHGRPRDRRARASVRECPLSCAGGEPDP